MRNVGTFLLNKIKYHVFKKQFIAYSKNILSIQRNAPNLYIKPAKFHCTYLL